MMYYAQLEDRINSHYAVEEHQCDTADEAVQFFLAHYPMRVRKVFFVEYYTVNMIGEVHIRGRRRIHVYETPIPFFSEYRT